MKVKEKGERRRKKKEKEKGRRERKKREKEKEERERERESREGKRKNRKRKFRAKIQRDLSPLQILLVCSSINKVRGSGVELFLY